MTFYCAIRVALRTSYFPFQRLSLPAVDNCSPGPQQDRPSARTKRRDDNSFVFARLSARLSVRQPHSMEAPPSPLSSRPELRRSVVERSAVQRSFPGNVFRQSVRGFPTSRCRQRPRVRLSLKRAACRLSNPRVYTGNPGKRSGGTCGSAVLYWKCFQPSMPDTNPSRTTVPPQEPAIALRECYDV